MKNANQTPDYEVMRLRSITDIMAAEALMESELYDHAIQQSHFALEKIMKSALLKAGTYPPLTHNLLRISNVRVGSRKILLKVIKSNPTMLLYWEKVHGRWSTDLRYGFLSLEPSDYDELFEAYRGLAGWIRVKLVES